MEWRRRIKRSAKRIDSLMLTGSWPENWKRMIIRGELGKWIMVKKNDSVINNTFVKMMEVLGYDIELHYVKRNE